MNPVVSTIVSLIGSIFSRIIPDKNMEMQAKLKLAELAAQGELKELEGAIDNALEQIKVNTEQAKSNNLFVSGPRPFIMWGMGGCLVVYLVLSTITSFAIAWGAPAIPMPPLDPMIRDITLGLLGLGWVSRTYEKTRGK